jgi:hypothetical protein
LADRYTSDTYAKAIVRGCDHAERADRQAAENAAAAAEGRRPVRVPLVIKDSERKAPRTVPRWHSNQLRHNHATDVRRRYGLEAAQAVLGHSHADVTEVYAERNLGLAEKVALEVG